jgi:hypothetical protein
MFLRGGCLNIYTSIHGYVCFPFELCDHSEPFFLRMKRFGALLAASAVLFVCALGQRPLLAKADADQIAVSVGRLLEEGHYTRQPLNADVSKRFLQSYLELLDYSHLFFTQKDIDALTAKYGPTRFTISTLSVWMTV